MATTGLSIDPRAKLLKKCGLVIVNGEGSIHHDRNMHLVEIAAHHKAVLVNSVWAENSPYRALRKFRYVAVREGRSAAAMAAAGVDAEVVPDLLFASPRVRRYREKRPEQRVETAITDNVLDRESGRAPFVACAEDYLDWLASARWACCGRFHAAVASAVMGIPFNTWESNTHKTLGLMEDLGVPDRHFPTQREALDAGPLEVASSVEQYVKRAPQRIEAMFARIAALA